MHTALGKAQVVISEEVLALRNANRTGEEILVSTRHKSKKLRARSKDSINIYGMIMHPNTLDINSAADSDIQD